MTKKIAVNTREDLSFKPEYQVNSWFAVGHFTQDGETISYLFHMMTQENQFGKTLNTNFSVTNETTGFYYAEDKIFSFDEGIVKTDSFYVEAPTGSMNGNFDEMKIKAKMKDVELDVVFKSKGDVIYNAGEGRFFVGFINDYVYQYSMPNLETTGTLKIQGKTYDASLGKSWFDRQWQISLEAIKSGKTTRFDGWKWTWMDLHLTNGDIISLWDLTDIVENTSKAWGTIIHPDKTQEVVEVTPLNQDEREVWVSPVTGQNYPTRWTVHIPEKNSVLEVSTDIPEQEIVSSSPFLNKYEGACRVEGTYEGKEISGYTYVELLGEWK